LEAQDQRLTESQFRAVCEFKTMSESRRSAAFRLVVQGVAPAEVARDNGWTRQAAALLRGDVLRTWRRFERAAIVVWPALAKNAAKSPRAVRGRIGQPKVKRK
jgi:hypothetical protein